MNAWIGHPARLPRGFTLVELLVAVGLLALLIVMAGFIFTTTTSAISTAQGFSEMMANETAFVRVLRSDLRGIERDSFLVMGRRDQEGFGNPVDRGENFKQDFRTDWLMFFTVTEKDAGLSGRHIGQWSRIFYGHGKVSDITQSGFWDQTSTIPFISNYYDSFSPLATDWVILRDHVAILPRVRASGAGLVGISVPGGGMSQFSLQPNVERSLMSYTQREMRWTAYYNMQYVGMEDLGWGPFDNMSRRLIVDEPRYYHTLADRWYRYSDTRKLYVLPHCGDFKVQYAMPADLVNGQVTWRDPPARNGATNPQDPNYDAGDSMHNDQTNQSGRLTFGPGDTWPILLKITVMVFDPLSRISGGRSCEVIVPLP